MTYLILIGLYFLANIMLIGVMDVRWFFRDNGKLVGLLGVLAVLLLGIPICICGFFRREKFH